MNVEQCNRVDYVGLAEFNYNVVTHLVTKQLPFKVAYGIMPLHPIDSKLKGAQSTLEFSQHGKDLAKK
jgi:hypothetical protein